MNVAIVLLTVLLAIDCIVLLLLILIQRGKGGGLSSAFGGGGGGGESAFGTRAVSTAKKATIVTAVLFIVLTCVLGYVTRISRQEVFEEAPPMTMPTEPAPGPGPGQPQ